MPRTSEFTKLSSHVIGSDHVGRRVDVQPDVPLEGIYGSSGFYFQQRRGRLDLRSLAQIDLEKVVRDVDIDVLQMSLENICFCNLREEDLRFITDQHVVKIFRAAQLVIEYLLYAQEQLADNCNVLSNKYSAKKRSVMKKRKELMELQENSKVLRAQLRSKKKSIKTLEQLLKDASHNKRRSDDVVQPASPPPKKRPSILRFFVSNSNGLCVEFNLRPNTFVYELLKEVKQAFVSRRDREDYHSSSKRKSKAVEIQLIYQGKVLLEGNTLEEVDVQPNDTLIAVIPALNEENDEKEQNLPQAEVDDEKRRREEFERQQQMMDFFTKQQEMMKENWGLLVAKLSDKFNIPVAEDKHDPHTQRDLEAKLAAMESAIHHQMKIEFDQMRESMGSLSHKSRFIVGELEDDDDEHQRELERKIKLSNQRLRELEGKLEESDYTVSELRKLQRAQAEELEELRRLIREFNRQPSAVQQHQQPEPVPVKRSIDSGGRKQPKTHGGKWNQFALAGKSAEPVVQQQSPSRVVEEVVEAKKQEPTPVVVPKKKVKTPPPAKVHSPVSRPAVRTVTVTFPAERMTHLAQVVGLWGEALDVAVLEDITPDDLIFEIRRVVAEKAKMPLARVNLCVGGTDVFLAVDLPSGVQLSAATAPGLIQRGELVVEVRNPITDAQLDTLGAQMEHDSDANEYLSGDGRGEGTKGRNFNKSLDMRMSLRRSVVSNSESDTEQMYSDTLRQYNKSNKGKARNYDSDSDSDSAGEREEEIVINHYRNSLSSTLVGLGDVKGLTDDELEEKMAHLKSSMEGLPPKVSKNLIGYRGAVPGTVSAAIDSGSEDFSDWDNDKSNGNRIRSSKGDIRIEKSLRLAPEGMVGRNSSSHNITVGGPLEGIGLRRKGKDGMRDTDTITSERRLFSSSLTLSRNGGVGVGGRKLRDYDIQDDGDVDSEPVVSKYSHSHNDMRSSHISRNSPQTRYSSNVGSDDCDDDNNGDNDDEADEDRLAQEYLEQYEREGGGGMNLSMVSSGTAEEKRDYLSSRATGSGGQQRGRKSDAKHNDDSSHDSGNSEGEDFNDTSSLGSASLHQGKHASRLSPSDLVRDDDEEDDDDRRGGGDAHLLLSTTVDTDISMPDGEEGNDTLTHSFDRESSVSRRADEYERDVADPPASSSKPPRGSSASGGGMHTPTSRGSQQQLHSSKNSNDTSSPFDHLTSDFDEDNDMDMLEGSLDLSQSADTFGNGTNLELSSFSKNH